MIDISKPISSKEANKIRDGGLLKPPRFIDLFLSYTLLSLRRLMRGTILASWVCYLLYVIRLVLLV